MSDYGQEVANRLRALVDEAGGPKAFADRLGTTDDMVQQYLRGKALPGNKMRQRMRDAGFDDFWVMHGSKEEADAKHRKNFLLNLREVHPEKAKMLTLLEEFGIETEEKLREILNWWKGVMGSAARMVAETKVKYRTKKKGGSS